MQQLTGHLVAQLLLNSLVSGAIYSLIGLSFGLVYRPAGFFHVAHAAVFACGAYASLVAIQATSLPVTVCVGVGALSATVVGCLVEVAVYRPLRVRGVGAEGLLVASLALFTLIQSCLSMIFGDASKRTRRQAVESTWEVVGAYVTTTQLLTLSVSLLAGTLVLLLLRRTQFGLALRAIADDALLAETSGLEIARGLLGSMALASFLAGTCGALVALDSDAFPRMGFKALLIGVAAVIFVGSETIEAAMIGGFLVGAIQHAGALFLGARWQFSAVFLVLYTALLFKNRNPHTS